MPSPAVQPPRHIKCLVWDLDNTLWNGVLLEGDAVSPRAGTLRTLEALDQRGILQSIASRSDARAALTKLADLEIDRYFLCPEIDWGAKSASVRTIADTLNIALRNIAFVDDDPFERAEVAANCPNILCLDAAEIDRLPERPEFDPGPVTVEARARRQMYLADERRQRAEAQAPNPRAFLATLDMRLTLFEARADDLRRAEELTLRTSQLNSTGRVYSPDELDALRCSPDHALILADLVDRFGSYGTIGLVLLSTAEAWTIRLLSTSCRTVSRGIGQTLLLVLAQAAHERGVSLRASYVPTSRNRIAHIALQFAGFREIERSDTASLLEHVADGLPPIPAHVQVRTIGLERLFDPLAAARPKVTDR